MQHRLMSLQLLSVATFIVAGAAPHRWLPRDAPYAPTTLGVVPGYLGFISIMVMLLVRWLGLGVDLSCESSCLHGSDRKLKSLLQCHAYLTNGTQPHRRVPTLGQQSQARTLGTQAEQLLSIPGDTTRARLRLVRLCYTRRRNTHSSVTQHRGFIPARAGLRRPQRRT
jgi:hypothetical protein